MKLKNTSKIFETEIIRKITKFVKPAGITNFDIWVKNSKSWGGRAYYKGCSYHGSFAPYIVIRINSKLHYPLNVNPRQSPGYLKHIKLYSAIEFLVYMIAHELRHLWQNKHPKGWRVWGAKGQFSERDADAYALHKIREWRRT